MIWKYKYGHPFETEAVIENIKESEGIPPFVTVDLQQGFRCRYKLSKDDIVYGLGEAARGINKRGHCYISNASDDPDHMESTKSMYGAHNFIVVAGAKNFGLFVDYPAKLTFDIGYTFTDILEIICPEADLYLYVIEGETPYEIVKQFRKIIGRSYIPPKFAFGFGQSRWGYKTKEDFRRAADGYRENHIPIDMIYMDIDYMQDFKDFTLNEEHFKDFPEFVKEMKTRNIRLIPIIDAGVKIEEGYRVYEEGVRNGYFCKRADGSNFVAAVWPGYTHFPDVLNPEARRWFGGCYRALINQGIEGFWNDMNEPAIFYTPEGLEAASELMRDYIEDETGRISIFQVREALTGLQNNPNYYEDFYHQVDGRMVRHDKVHNLFGYNMTKAAGEEFERIDPDRRFLLFSRSSYIGMHRYGGIWTGDNKSWWSHLGLIVHQLPAINMAGFLYTGPDLGGFGADTTRDLVLRFLQIGVFTPLMRNHSALGTREQEPYQFERPEDFRHLIGLRYRLVPYLYSEYLKAIENDTLMFKALAFEYKDDPIASQIEDQLLLGDEIMLAPVLTQNATGRAVYLPQAMTKVVFHADETIEQIPMDAGWHFVDYPLNELVFFIRPGKAVPLAKAARRVTDIDWNALEWLGDGREYTLYDDDGTTKEDTLIIKNLERQK